MTPEIIAGETISRNGNDCYITITIALVEMGYQYVLLMTEIVSGWCDDEDAEIKWIGSDKEEGLKQYNAFVKEISR